MRRFGLGLALAGVDPIAMWRTARGAPRYIRDLRRFRALSRRAGVTVPRYREVLPVAGDRDEQAGAGNEYFLADLWVARRIFEKKPGRHVDVGSRIDGLVAHLLTFVDVDVVDIRPLDSRVDGLRFVQADATSLQEIPEQSARSVSSVHALEHFGLGRYGDPLEPEGHVKGLRALGRIVAPGGSLYVGVPVGRPCIEFNAHRVLSPELVPATLPGFTLAAFAGIVDGVLDDHAHPADLADEARAFGLYELTCTDSPVRPVP